MGPSLVLSGGDHAKDHLRRNAPYPVSGDWKPFVSALTSGDGCFESGPAGRPSNGGVATLVGFMAEASEGR